MSNVEQTSVDYDEEDAFEEADSDEEEYEYEDEDNCSSGFLVDNPDAAVEALMKEETSHSTNSRSDNRYSKEAVAMSHRVVTEASSGKRRLASDLHKLMTQDTEAKGFTFTPTHEDSMDKWTIKMSGFDEESDLAKDMLVIGLDHIELEMKFPDDYPFEPPFVRVIKPRFVRRTGFVVSGALCMELLTKDGWRPTNDIESVIVSIRSLMVEGGGRLEAVSALEPSNYAQLLQSAKQDKKPSGEQSEEFILGSYTEYEAKDGYVRATSQHKEVGYSDTVTRKG